MHTKGFTLIEFMVVIIIIGILLAIILPRGMRAQNDARFAMIRQHATEIASYTVEWGQNKVRTQEESGEYLIRDVLTTEINDFSKPLAEHYTGHENFRSQLAVPQPPENPFNSRSYFSEANNSEETPAPEPGLLYLTFSPDDPETDSQKGAFYYIFTGIPDNEEPEWYNDTGTDPDQARRGIFVMRIFN